MNINQFTAADLTRLQAISQRLVDGYNSQDVFAANSDQKLGSLLKLIVDLALTGNLPAGIKVINKSGGTIAKFKAVGLALAADGVGWDAATDSWCIKALSTAAGVSGIGWPLGVLDADLADGAATILKSNYVLVGALNTAASAVGRPVYANPADGSLTLTAPGAAKNNPVVGCVASVANPGDIRLLPAGAIPPAVYIAAA